MVYPAIHWCLERLPQLKKRAYLARYLMPVEIPAEFMQDQALMDLHEMYLKMQASCSDPPNDLRCVGGGVKRDVVTDACLRTMRGTA